MVLFKSNTAKWCGLIITLLLCIVVLAISPMLGRTFVPLKEVIAAILHYNPESIADVVVYTERLPRAIIGIVVGASLAVAGALMQALTRNPLASPSTFGINAGAIFFVVIASLLFSITEMTQLMWFAFAGALVAAVIVYGLGSIGRDGLTPIKIVLAGSAILALFTSFTQAMLVLNETGMQNVLFWLAGAIGGRTLAMLQPVLPLLTIAGVTALCMGRAINLFVTGEEIAKGMGQRVLLLKLVIGLIIIILAGGSVAIVGAVGFVGLFIPHIARALVGADYRWIIPFSGALGGLLLMTADLVARLVIIPAEIPLGVMTAFIGVPFFIYIARKGVTWK